MAGIFADEIKLEADAPDPQSGNKEHLLVYFLPGNPGAVEYYRNFLQDVKDDLQEGPESFGHVTVYGHSHDGFELGTTTRPDSEANSPPFTLKQTIEGAKTRLQATVRQIATSRREKLKVVLVGHSVGSYMLMELVSWWQNKASEIGVENTGFRLVGGVCLFPTVVDITQSPKGKTMSWVLAIPYLHLAASWLAAILAYVTFWDWAKILTPGDNPDKFYIDLTRAVISSRYGAQQAAYLASYEMKEIREDKWHPSHVWGAHEPDVISTEASAIKAGLQRTRLFYYWGNDDYWVDNNSRNKLIQQRARRADDSKTSNQATMIIDKNGMDHCFSLDRRHCKIVATQTAAWIRELEA